ncbi:MAG TPA: SMC-Scp complex subunit ScpB [Actinomycetota bacterium]|nr:SMC-Scp complex subunit ScpB [Actinomycetota bacterium]
MQRDPLTRDLEALLLVAAEPLPAAALASVVEVPRREVEEALQRLSDRYEESGSGILLRNVAGGWRLFTHPDANEVVERFILSSRHARLSRAALETLAIVAYKQPVTRHQVAAIRGVNSDGVLKALTDRGLLQEVGRDEGPGRPLLYGTTPEFLERLGLASVQDLPPLAPLLGEEEPEEDGAGEAAAGA